MKHPSGEKHMRIPLDVRAKTSRRKIKRPYSRPRVDPAGSVFEQTKALGSGTKDALTGSVLL